MQVQEYVFRMDEGQNGVFTVCEDEKYGLVSLPLQGKDISETTNAAELEAQGGTFIVLPQWDEIRANVYLESDDEITGEEMLSSGFLCEYYVLKDGLWGILDETGRLIQEPLYKEVTIVNSYPFNKGLDPDFLGAPFSRDSTSGRVLVRKGNKWGMLHGHGQEVLPLVYDDIRIIFYHYARHHVYVVRKEGLCGVTDQTGRFLIPMMYPSLYCNTLEYLRDDTAFRIESKEGIGYVRLGDGKCLASPVWERIDVGKLYTDSDNEPCGYIFTVWKDDHCGLIFNDKGLIIPPEWDEIVPRRTFIYDDPLSYSVRRGKHWGCCDENGFLISDALWDETDAYHNGIACVKKGSQWGAIGADGQLCVPVQWDEIEGFGIKNTLSSAEVKTADIPSELLLHENTHLPDCFSWVRRNDLWGLIDRDGNVIEEPIWEIHNGAYGRRFDNGWLELKVRRSVANISDEEAAKIMDYLCEAIDCEEEDFEIEEDEMLNMGPDQSPEDEEIISDKVLTDSQDGIEYHIVVRRVERKK